MGTNWKSLTALVVTAAMLVTAGVIAAVNWIPSTQDRSNATSPTNEPLAASDSGDLEPWAARARSLYASWAGTADERQAAEVVVAHALNGAYSECMAEEGYPRPWQSSISPAPVYGDPLVYSYWAASRLDHYYSQKLINAEIGQRIGQAANSQEAQGEEVAAERACRESNPGASDDDVSSTRAPAPALLGQWAAALAPVLGEGGDIESYETCIAASGVLDELGVESTEQARSMLSTPMPLGSDPIGGEPPTPQWDEYLMNEQAFVDADWECREDTRAGSANWSISRLTPWRPNTPTRSPLRFSVGTPSCKRPPDSAGHRRIPKRVRKYLPRPDPVGHRGYSRSADHAGGLVAPARSS